jgi:hypothetical protein
MFRALSHQLFQTEEKHKQVRAEIISWLRKNANFAIDDSGKFFFLKLMKGTKLSDFLDVDRYRSWDGFCNRMSKDATW